MPSGAAARPEARAFRPPPPAGRAAETVPQIAAPPLAVNPNPKLALPVPSGAAARPEARAFRPNLPAAARPGPAPAVSAPPQLAPTRADGVPGALASVVPGPARPQPRAFLSPGRPGAGGSSATSPAPEIAAPDFAVADAPPGPLSMAIVGLNPAARLDVAPPEGSLEARFSAGPEKRASGGDGEPVESARIFVPGLMVRGGGQAPAQPLLVARAAPTSPENLRRVLAAAPPVPAPAVSAPASAPSAAVHVISAPDPLLEGRTVYSMAVQMPNITSYSGSWLVWFAERGEKPGAPSDVLPPVPLHKVDPRYIASAADERVEGKVRLAAVIRADGTVDSVALLARLDDRLDSSALDALGKWRFEPARRNGRPVEVDAVVEIPFRLAPRVPR